MGLSHAIISITMPRFGIKAKLLVRTTKWPEHGSHAQAPYALQLASIRRLRGLVIFIY